MFTQAMSFQTEIAFCSLLCGLKNCQITDRGMRPCYGEVEEKEEEDEEEEEEEIKSVVLSLQMLLNTSKICKSFANNKKNPMQTFTWKFHVETD